MHFFAVKFIKIARDLNIMWRLICPQWDQKGQNFVDKAHCYKFGIERIAVSDVDWNGFSITA